MPERSSRFVSMALSLLAMAFAVGFGAMLWSIGKADVLYSLALRWELTGALLYLARWAPAVLLVSSAVAMEGSNTGGGFAGTASKILMPAFAFAVAVSLFYLLIVPMVEDKKAAYEGASKVFEESLLSAEEAYESGDYDTARRFLVACAAIDPREERYERLDGLVGAAIARSAPEPSADPEAETPPAKPAGMEEEANRFYLEAQRALSDGRFLEAHYLARRSAELNPKRPEVQRLVEKTWQEIERRSPPKSDVEAAAFYKRKLQGYQYFQEGDYLAAYRTFSELASEKSEDKDVETYLRRSEEGLSSIAFFIEEDENAFKRAGKRSFSLTIATETGAVRVAAAMAAEAREAMYFRDVIVSRSDASGDYLVRARFARLHGATMILRAVDRSAPDRVWEPVYEKGEAASIGVAIELPFTQDDAADALMLTGEPRNVPITRLVPGMAAAKRLGIDEGPLLAELAHRSAYPFMVIMLVLVGSSLGIRFKPTEPPSRLATFGMAPFLVALSMPPMALAGRLEPLATEALAAWLPPAAFMPAWLGFLGACTAFCLLLAARIASHAPDR